VGAGWAEILGNFGGGVVVGALGIFWKRLARNTLPRRLVETAALFATDFRAWMAVLAVLFAGDIGLIVFDSLPPQPQTPFHYIDQYGPSPLVPGLPVTGVYLRASGSEILAHMKKSVLSRYFVGMAAYHYYGSSDVDDTRFELKGDLRKITEGDIEWVIPLNDSFKKLLSSGSRTTNFALFLIPRGAKVEQYNTMGEVKALGGILLENVAGPP